MEYRKVLEEQFFLIADWNKKHFDEEPDLARLNIDAMCKILEQLSFLPE